jgi:hypothetical protein
MDLSVDLPNLVSLQLFIYVKFNLIENLYIIAIQMISTDMM